jgi:hypothetical protein
VTKTDTWQTRPLVREVAPKRQDSNFEGGKKFWSNVQDLGSTQRPTDRPTDWPTDRPSVAMCLWLWLWQTEDTRILKNKRCLDVAARMAQSVRRRVMGWPAGEVPFSTPQCPHSSSGPSSLVSNGYREPFSGGDADRAWSRLPTSTYRRGKDSWKYSVSSWFSI